MLKRVIPFAHQLIQEVVRPGESVIDATCGNGHDTVMLSKATGETGKVYAFDVQSKAIEKTKERLATASLNNVQLIHDGHENVSNYLQEREQVAGAIFNLGYLPGSDKTVITKPTQTIEAIDQIVERLKEGGRIVCVVYYGHPGGEEEKDALFDHFRQFDQKEFDCLQYGFINQENKPPFVLALEKKQTD